MSSRDFLLIACSFGGIQSLLWALYLMVFNEQKTRQNLLLGGLFAALSLRVLKSTYFLFSEEMSLVFINLGFAAHLAVGPLLLYYLQSIYKDEALPKVFWLQMIPAFLVALLSPWLTLGGFWYAGGYTALLFQSIAYLPLIIYMGWKHRKSLTRIQSHWLMLLVVGVSLVMIAYFSNWVLGISSYTYGPALYAGVTYIFSFFLLKNFQKLTAVKKTKYKNIKLSKSRFSEYKQKIVEHFESNEPYLQNDYTLAKLSAETKIPKHLLSPIFSEQFEVSFTEFLNSYRIKMAQELLRDKPNITVSAIAYDCGFNTLSSFNQAFKKLTGTTPSAYRKSLMVA